MAGYTRTVILLAALTALFGVIGLMIGGEQGMIMALLFAGGMNLFSWWNSDKMVLRMHNAQPMSPQEAPRLYDMTAKLAANAGLPMPALYVIHEEQPNAFATGRNPQNAAVAVNTGLLDMLSEEEVAGVIAHELAHIKNRDTLVMTVTASIAGAISALAQFGMLFGRGRDRQNPFGPIGLLLMVILAPRPIRQPRICSSSTRYRARGWIIFSRPIRARITAWRRWNNWLPAWGRCRGVVPGVQAPSRPLPSRHRHGAALGGKAGGGSLAGLDYGHEKTPAPAPFGRDRPAGH